MAQSLNDLILEQFPAGKKTEPGQYSPLALAFLGDAVFSLIIRTVVLSQGSRQAEKLLARKDASDPDVRRKAVQALVRRGYGWDAAREAVEAVSSETTAENGGE